ncbi:hypothetical protein SLEP1_g42053 [Rubroshorea leprosula]|uniref:Uncharacterized protein n=1 Tax=Rubroshorea leprosula TaxID=152421 RepID=A0AAV5L8J9_9ROSI|nr:hypothetical protein SLEP1_g42053 [Rubroshorea leprosula]
MESKLKSRRGRSLFMSALLGLLLHIVSSWLLGFLHSLEPQIFSEVVRTSIRNGFVTMTIKFLHFVIAKCMQFRHAWLLYPVRSTMSCWLFWIAFSRPISHPQASLLAFIFGYCHLTIFHSSWQNESHLGHFL